MYFKNLTVLLKKLDFHLQRKDKALVCVVSGIISFCFIWFGSLSEPFHLKILDLKDKFRSSWSQRNNEDLVLLAIDNDTLIQAPEKWPWSQNYWGEIIDSITANSSPTAIILDIYFQAQETESKSTTNFPRALKNNGKVGLIALYEEFVTELGNQVKYIPPAKPLRKSAAFVGLSQFPLDSDGKVRTFMATDQRIARKHISLEFMHFLNKRFPFQEILEAEKKAVCLLDFSSSRAGVEQISLGMVLKSPKSLSLLNGKIVLIGSTAPVLHDYHQTPSGMITGPELVCNSIATLLDSKIQLVRKSVLDRAVYFFLGVVLCFFLVADIFGKSLRSMFIIWLILPLILFFYSFWPLFHPPIEIFWAGYSFFGLLVCLFSRFLELSDLRLQLLEGEICGQIQKSFFPEKELETEQGVICFGRCIPYKDAGGDFYDFMELGDGRVFFMLGDVTGHGISAGMITTVAKSMVIQESEKDDFDLQNLFNQISLTIFKMTKKRRMMTGVAGIISADKSTVRLISAGHLPTIVKIENEIFEHPLPSLPLGVSKKKKKFSEKTIEAPTVGKLFIYSDGFVEGLDWDNELLGYERLFGQIADLPPRFKPEEDFDELVHKLKMHTKGRHFEDDVTLLVIQFKDKEIGSYEKVV